MCGLIYFHMIHEKEAFKISLDFNRNSRDDGRKMVGFFLVELTWPMAKLFQLFGITYLVGKISRSNWICFRVRFGRRMVSERWKLDRKFGLLV